MSRLRIYGDQSGYLDLVAPDSARNNVINLDGLVTEDANGNVGIGIGTDTPSSKLDVRGDIKIQDTIPEILFKSPDGSSNQYFIGANISDAVDGGFIIGEGSGVTGGTARVTIDGSGFVGIGTTSPDTILEIVDRAPVLQIRDTNTGITDNLATLRLAETGAGDTTDNYYDLALENGDFIINYGATNRVKIDRTTGYVGINTTAPSALLDVNGDLRVQGNFTVDGTTTTINSTTLNVDDLNITVASGAVDAAAADGAGLTVDTVNATLTYVNAGDNWSFNKDLNLDGDLTVGGGQVTMAAVGTRDKYRVWNSGTYAIGMDATLTYGGLNNYAMTFQFSNDDTRGYWWGDTAHTDAQGAMALTTNGKLTVAHSARIGHGEADTTTPGATHRLDVNGSIADDVSDVRAPRWTELTGASNHNLINEGVYTIQASSTFSQVIIGDGVNTYLTGGGAGTIMTIYNNRSTSVTLSRGTITDMRLAADGDYTNHATLTLGRNSVTTITAFYSSLLIVTGTDVT